MEKKLAVQAALIVLDAGNKAVRPPHIAAHGKQGSKQAEVVISVLRYKLALVRIAAKAIRQIGIVLTKQRDKLLAGGKVKDCFHTRRIPCPAQIVNQGVHIWT